MLRDNWRKRFLLASLAVTCLAMGQAHATAIIEVTSVKTYDDSVQVIAGDQVISPSPRPTIQHAAPSRPAPVLSTVKPSGYQPVSRDRITASIYKLRMNQRLQPGQVQEVATTIDALSRYYNIDPMLMVSLVAAESSFNPRAVSSSGAIGLGQLKPATAQWLGVQNPWDIRQNLWGVAKYLRYLLDRYNGSVEHALAAYYQGQGTIDRRGIDGSAKSYIGRINRYFTQL